MAGQGDVGTEATKRVAVALQQALARSEPREIEHLLDPDVRWGGIEDTEETCHNRAEVLAFYARLLADGTTLDVRDVRVEGEHIHLQVHVVSRSDGGGIDTFDQPTLVTVRGGLIVEVLQLDPLDG